MNIRRFGLLVVLAVVGVLVTARLVASQGGGGGHPFPSNLFNSQPPVVTCRVSSPGTNAVIAIHGPGATDFCRHEVNQDSYAWDNDADLSSEQIVCQVAWQGQRWTVWDQGVFGTSVGNTICQQLQKKSAGY